MKLARPQVGPAARTFRETSGRILRHPANRDRRSRALVLYLVWQVWQRVVRRPWTIRLGDARRLRLHPHSVVAAFVLYYRVHDYEEMSFLRAYLRPGDLFVDVGANVGVYSLWASETAGVDIIAFEPSSAAHARAVENVELNALGGRVNVVRKAVGGEQGEVRLTVGQGALNRVVGTSGGTEPVEQTTLDAELGTRQVAAIKVDVEGHELEVLRGGRESILRHRPAMLIEVNNPLGLRQVLDELGYSMWSYDPERRTLAPATPILHGNVLALADVEAARVRLGQPTLVPSSLSGSRIPLPTHVKLVMLQRLPFLRLLLLRRDFLRESGWLASGRRGTPVDRNGRPLPWYTYPALDFLTGRVRKDMAVFEYGAGNSTRWWAERVAHVSSVESDPDWMALLAPTLPANTDLRFEPADGAGYSRSAVERNRRFHIVVIDGDDRNACALASLSVLQDDGVIIWDNSDWSTLWAEGMAQLVANGFRSIDFRGPGPVSSRPWTTSIFYRDINCLGI